LSFFKSISIDRIPHAVVAAAASASASSSSSLQSMDDLPLKLQEIIRLFQGVQDPKAKYEQLLFYGRNLSPLDPKYKTNENKVQGCVSQVWVRAYLDSTTKTVNFEADSDSVLTKGLAALLVQSLSNQPLDQILKLSPDFVALLGLQQSLTPSRNNGFLNMLKLMQTKAAQLYTDADSADTTIAAAAANENVGAVKEKKKASKEASSRVMSELGKRGVRIKEKLEKGLRAVMVEIEDVSHQHAGHSGVKGSNGETHFNVRVISEEFEGKSLVKRHRLIYGLLEDELESGLHSLSIEAKTPSEL
ncbi:hypothetical protein M569_14846, partial [Genlisea aurea]